MQISGTQSSSTAFAYYDPRDLNRDRIVSPAEAFAYSLKHPAVDGPQQFQPKETTNSAPWDLYTQKGVLNSWEKTGNGLFDRYA